MKHRLQTTGRIKRAQTVGLFIHTHMYVYIYNFIYIYIIYINTCIHTGTYTRALSLWSSVALGTVVLVCHDDFTVDEEDDE